MFCSNEEDSLDFFFSLIQSAAVNHRDGKKTKKSQTRKAENHFLNAYIGTSPAVQWLGFCAPDAGGTGLIPGQRSRIPHPTWGRKKNFVLMFKIKYLKSM